MHCNSTTTDRHFTELINTCCREFSNWSRYTGIPKYDKALAACMRRQPYDLHLRFDFSSSGSEVFVPLRYFSETGGHRFYAAPFERDIATDVIKTIDPQRFLQLASGYAHEELFPAGPDLLHHLALGHDPATTPADQKCLPGTTVCIEMLMDDPGYSLITLLEQLSEQTGISLSDAAARWFGQYSCCLLNAWRDLLTAWSPGDAFPAGPAQLELDRDGFPISYRTGAVAGPGNAIDGPDELATAWAERVLFGQLLKPIGLLGGHDLCNERVLINMLYRDMSAIAVSEPHGVFQQVLYRRRLRVSGKLFARHGAYHRELFNPLHRFFACDAVLKPGMSDPLFSKYFPKEDITVSIRPFDIERDLEMAHSWFHEEHTKPIWKMDWPIPELERFYRTLLAEDISHSYIGEVNGVPTFNLEVYWATRDVLGDHYEVLPSDYGTHFMIAPTDKKKKFPAPSMRTVVEWLFSQPEVGRLVGEGSVDSVAALMNKVHVGFRLQRVIDMPHKSAHLNMCYRQWYHERFPSADPAPVCETLS